VSPERPDQDDFLEDEEQDEYEGQRSIFATGWFRAVLVLLVLAVIAVIAVPLIGGWFEPSAPPKLVTPAPIPKPSVPTPPPSAAPSTPAPTPATPPAPGPGATAPPAVTPAPVTPPAPATPAPTPPVATTPAPTPVPARPEIPPASAPTRAAEKGEKAKAPERTAALAPSKSSPKAPAAGNYWVQVGAFKEGRNAEGLAKTLRAEGFTVQVTQVTRDAPLHVVRVGGYLQGKGHTGFVTSGPPK
jgi:type IV secretory pathway VirB10-like protein